MLRCQGLQSVAKQTPVFQQQMALTGLVGNMGAARIIRRVDERERCRHVTQSRARLVQQSGPPWLFARVKETGEVIRGVLGLCMTMLAAGWRSHWPSISRL